jgi:hypothetical protein
VGRLCLARELALQKPEDADEGKTVSVKISGLCHQALGIMMAVAVLAGCSTTCLNFVAIDYEKLGHPSLTSAQVNIIHETLERVKPCQRSLVRYAVSSPEAKDLILYFAVPPSQGAHVFGTAIDVYFPDTGRDIPMDQTDPGAEQREKQGIQWDIEHQPCPRPP